MSVGIDFGTQFTTAAITRRGGIEVVLNESNYRQTESLVSFGPKERYLGQLIMNYKNTVFDFKRLIGRKFSDADAQLELKRLLCKSRELPDGSIGIEVIHKGEPHTFTPEQVCAMFFGKLKSDTEKELGGKFVDCVVSCPGWWNDAQRHALIASAQVAGLNVLRLIHESTAVALQYSIFKPDLPEKEPAHVMFIDVGHSQLSVMIADMTKKDFKVLASAYDPHLGGRNFDDILVDHFAKEFVTKYKLDIYTNPRALLRVRAASEKLKKVLSANPEAPISIESLMNDVDVKGFMKRDMFESLAKPLLDRMGATISKALDDAKLTAAQLTTIELVGGASRIPMVQRSLQEVLGREPGKTQNASESVVRGAVLAAAAMSLGARVKDVKVHDAFPYAVNVKHNQADAKELIKRNHTMPSEFTEIYAENHGFTIATEYADLNGLPAGTQGPIARWHVDVPASADGSKREVKVKLTLNESGLVNVANAHYVEVTEVVEPTPATPPAPAAPAAPAPTADGKDKMETDSTDAAKPAAAAPVPEPKKKKVSKIHNLVVKSEASTALPQQKVKQWAEEEARMTAEDKLFIETAERRNALESYVLTFRSRLGVEYSAYATAELKTELLKHLDEAEAWLNDAPDDTLKSVFVERHVKLQRLCDPVTHRYRDYTDNVPDALSTLRQAITTATTKASSTDAAFDHITDAEREPLRKEIAAASTWLAQQEAVFTAANKTQSPSVNMEDAKKKATSLSKMTSDVMGKAKPPPPKKEEEKKPDAAPAADAKSEGKKDEKKADGEAAKDKDAKPAHTQMDIDA